MVYSRLTIEERIEFWKKYRTLAEAEKDEIWRQRARDYSKEWYQKNKDRRAEYCKEYREKNKEKIKERTDNNRDRINEMRRNNENKQIYNKKYWEEHKDALKTAVDCPCGGCYIKNSKARHERTKKHLAWLINEPIERRRILEERTNPNIAQLILDFVE